MNLVKIWFKENSLQDIFIYFICYTYMHTLIYIYIFKDLRKTSLINLFTCQYSQLAPSYRFCHPLLFVVDY